MRPLRLTMSAFGPYAGEEHLDFADLAGRQFFLICGPTGAGKTTVLDAMCYALYGATSGNVRSGATMRSDYAGPARKTFVTFDFAVGAKQYRVYRSPEQTVLKKRGEGTTTAVMQASLTEIDADGQELRLVAAKDVTREIEGLLGFKADQFRQVVLLPQGDFRRLLLADSDDRQKIMEQLFRTELYLAVENELRERDSQIQKEYSQNREETEAVLKACGAGTETELETAAADAVRKAAAAAEEQKKSEVFQAAVQKAYDEAKELDSLWERMEASRKEEGLLSAQKERMAQTEKDLDKVRRAGQLTEAFANADRVLQQGQAKKKELGMCQVQAKAAEQELAAAEAAWTAWEKESSAQEERKANKTRLMQLEGDAAAWAAVQKEAEELTRQTAAAESLQKQLDQAEESAQKEAEWREKTAESFRIAYRHGHAAILAQKLKDGAPCPVCGSLAHPHPAETLEKLPADTDVDAAERAEKVAKELLETRRKEARIHRDSVLSERQKQLAAVSEKLKNLEARVAPAYRDPTLLKKEIASLEKAIAHYDAERECLQKQKEQAGKVLAALKASVANGITDIERLRKEYQSAMEELKRRSAAEGFADLTECGIWKEKIPFVKIWQEELDRYRGAVEKAAQNRAEAEKAIAGRQKPDMTRFEEERKQAVRRSGEANEAKGRADTERDTLKEGLVRLRILQKAQEALGLQHGLVHGLYGIVSGREPSTGVNFERFVLGALLDDVTEAANQRLQKMSRGRYLLQRRTGEGGEDLREDRRKKGGLDLEVFDNYTGEARPASTLSGGETFLASLSLALGLADVVQSYAGGIHLDAIFIDEGFGTLDQETLDNAVSTLMELQQGGRLVGIISHVPELSERIGAKLRITRTKEGSTAAFEIE